MAKIFSGEYSRKMWKTVDNAFTPREIRSALWLVCCQLKELEAKFDGHDHPPTDIEQEVAAMNTEELVAAIKESAGSWPACACGDKDCTMAEGHTQEHWRQCVNCDSAYVYVGDDDYKYCPYCGDNLEKQDAGGLYAPVKIHPSAWALIRSAPYPYDKSDSELARIYTNWYIERGEVLHYEDTKNMPAEKDNKIDAEHRERVLSELVRLVYFAPDPNEMTDKSIVENYRNWYYRSNRGQLLHYFRLRGELPRTIAPLSSLYDV